MQRHDYDRKESNFCPFCSCLWHIEFSLSYLFFFNYFFYEATLFFWIVLNSKAATFWSKKYLIRFFPDLILFSFAYVLVLNPQSLGFDALQSLITHFNVLVLIGAVFSTAWLPCLNFAFRVSAPSIMGKSCKVVVCGQYAVGKTAVLEQLLYSNHVAGMPNF